MKTKKNHNGFNLESVINQRLNLNINQRILEEEFQVPFPTLNRIKNSMLLKKDYANWSEEKRNKFIIVIGGRANFAKTKDYLNQILLN